MADKEKIISHLNAYIDCLRNRHKMCDSNCVLYGHGDCLKYIIEYIANAVDLLKEQPDIVSCKDCMHYDNDSLECKNDDIDILIHHCGCYPAFTPCPDWFCAYGKRR